jgi:hypothetical protein
MKPGLVRLGVPDMIMKVRGLFTDRSQKVLSDQYQIEVFWVTGTYILRGPLSISAVHTLSRGI